MNCKQGDLAVIVRSYAGNEGKIVGLIRIATTSEVIAEGFAWIGPVWVIDTELKCTDGSFSKLQPDARLRPIRDQDGQDETLTWLDVPSKEIA